MMGPDRITGVLKAYSDGARTDYKPRGPAGRIEDTVQISSEGLQKSKEYLSKLKNEAYSQSAASSSRQGNDLLDILNLSAGASIDQIHRAFLSAIKQYHPDKFNDLSPEFKKLAEEKSKQIILAYEKLTKTSR